MLVILLKSFRESFGRIPNNHILEVLHFASSENRLLLTAGEGYLPEVKATQYTVIEAEHCVWCDSLVVWGCPILPDGFYPKQTQSGPMLGRQQNSPLSTLKHIIAGTELWHEPKRAGIFLQERYFIRVEPQSKKWNWNCHSVKLTHLNNMLIRELFLCTVIRDILLDPSITLFKHH